MTQHIYIYILNTSGVWECICGAPTRPGEQTRTMHALDQYAYGGRESLQAGDATCAHTMNTCIATGQLNYAFSNF